MISEELLAILVCPACRGELDHEEDVSLTCRACGRAYPIRDGIPIMLIEEASGGPEETSEAGEEDPAD